MKNEMPFHTDNTAIIPYTFKSLPKKLMEESHKTDNKFLNNHLSEIEEAVDKKLMGKTSFVNQQIKYHGKSGVLNHDNFFHCDLATGTPISNDNFHHSNFVINPYTSESGCSGGDDLEMFSGSGSYGNFGGDYLFIQRSSDTNGTVDECYDQIAVKSDNTSGNVRLGVYDDDGSDPDELYASTGSISLYSDYSFKPITEFTLTTVKTWLAFVKSEASNMFQESSTSASAEVRTETFSYATLPDPAEWTDDEVTDLRQMKIGHS